jgi:hypothetical protein
VNVFQLEANQDAQRWADDARFESGLTQFQSGNWAAAKETFSSMLPADSVAEFLVDFMGQRGSTAPPEFNGVVELKTK